MESYYKKCGIMAVIFSPLKFAISTGLSLKQALIEMSVRGWKAVTLKYSITVTYYVTASAGRKGLYVPETF
jgi:hypothetical protein